MFYTVAISVQRCEATGCVWGRILGQVTLMTLSDQCSATPEGLKGLALPYFRLLTLQRNMENAMQFGTPQ